MSRLRYFLKSIIVAFLRLIEKYPLGEGNLSLRAHVDGFIRNIYLAKGVKVKRDVWFSCVDKDSTIQIGENTGISPYVKIRVQNGGFVKIGKHCSVHSFSVIYGDGGVTIGDYVRIATHCVIVPNNHKFDDPTKNIYDQGLERKEIIIKDDVWLGAGVTVLAGVTIGAHSVVAAGAVVTKDVPEYSVVGGVPAKILKSRI